VIDEIKHALGPNAGLTVQTADEHVAQQRGLDREALARLSQMATVIPIVAVLAIAAAMGALVWQRRPRLAKLKLEGLSRSELWRTILLESLLLLCVGCVTGALFGVYGQRLADRALARVIDFPVAYSLAPSSTLLSLSLVIATALAILAVPGYLAARTPAALALQD
jgi:putative ABC transport system permease protein